jgi:hypothetical protein
MVKAPTPKVVVRSQVRSARADPPEFVYEIWTDIGDDWRMRVQISRPYPTAEDARIACEKGVSIYPAKPTH